MQHKQRFTNVTLVTPFGEEDKDLTEGDAPCLCGNAQVEVVMVQEPHKERSS